MVRSLSAAILALCATAACAAAEPAPAPALYVARDADSTLYLYGTIHLRKAGEPWGSPAVEQALARSDEIWTELLISPESEARTQALAAQAGMAAPGRPLSSWLSEAERARFNATVTRLGLQPQALEPMRPWLAGLTLTLVPIMRAGYDPSAGVDRAIDAFGDARGKSMRALETPEQQIGFFANMSDDMQRQMLLESIDEAERGVAVLDQLSKAWERGDTQLLQRELNDEMRADYPAVYEALITDRNDAWVATLMHELQGAGVDFVAVGAAHIVGDEGLVAQLRARGVTVERVEARR
jgi:uncharacterized protein